MARLLKLWWLAALCVLVALAVALANPCVRGSYGVSKLFERIGPERVVLVWSLWRGYWERSRGLRSWAHRAGLEPHFVHSGGHAWPEDLERLVAAIGAKETIWVHTDAQLSS
jgi:hypothetical protein